MKNIFTEIYATNGWGQGSGEGSLPQNTKAYRQFLQQFIYGRNIKSVVDYGCGDWQFSKLIDWSNVQYLGLDVVDSLIEHHSKVYGSNNIKFKAINAISDELPDAELIIIKDVLQHWSNRTIMSFIPKINKYKYALVTNSVKPDGETDNEDTCDGGYHYLDLRKPPFCYNMNAVLEYTNEEALHDPAKLWWKKLVLLQENKNAS